MKPLNLDNSPCSPISSNCVIWQGKDLPCIKLCTGDTVSDVVFKLATELCAILDELNISNYDLACLNLPCGPDDFQGLIQILIQKICDLENIPVPTPSGGDSCCSTPVAVALCLGGGSATLIDYVNIIGLKICDILQDINDINTVVVNLDTRVEILENTPAPVFTMPTVLTTCTIGTIPPLLAPGTHDIDVVLQRFINEEWCPLEASLGTASALSAAVLTQCVDGIDSSLKFQYSVPGTQMQIAYPSYVASPTTVADTINNLWIALCDVRNAGKQLTAVAAGPNTIVTSATAIVGNNEVTTYTIESTTNPLDTLNEGVSLTTNTASMNFVGDLVNATTVGDNVTVTVNTFGGMLAQEQPANLNSVAFGLANVLCFQPVQIIAEIYDDDNAYNPVTGVWTCPATGRYNLSCYAHYTKDSADGWYDSLNPGGMFGVGVFSSTGCNFYCANWMTITGIQKHIDITAQAMGISIAAGTQLSVKVLNQTGFNYTSTTGDALRFSIERIK